MSDLKNYFDFSKSEQRGMLALSILIVLLMIVRIVLPHYKLANQTDTTAAKAKELFEKIDSNIASAQSSTPAVAVRAKANYNSLPSLHNFDPNTANEAELIDLGFKESQIKNIVNYRNKGGKFFKKEDLKKLYTIKPIDYERIESFISLKQTDKIHLDSKHETQIFEVKNAKSATLQVDINSADTTSLKQLKGIGSYFARKIVERRVKLGGFVNKQQLLEIWNIDPLVLENNASSIYLDQNKVRKINLNKASVEEFKQHPYFPWKIANALVKMRAQQGKFTAIKEIRNSVLISDSLYSKIAPYLTLDD